MAAWQTITSPPTGSNVDSWQLVSYNNKVYLTMAWTESLGSGWPDVLEYDPNTDSYVALATCPTPCTYGASAVVGNKWYHFGGYSSGSVRLDRVAVYNFDTDSWSAATAMPEVRADMAATAIGTNIYLTGGSYEFMVGEDGPFVATLSDHVRIYNTVTDSWSSGVGMPLETSYHAALSDDTDLYVLGGWIGGSDDSAAIYKLDISESVWTYVDDLQYTLEGTGGVRVGDYFYLVAGYSSDVGDDITSVLAWNYVTGDDNTDTDHPEGGWGTKAALVSSTLYSFSYPNTAYSLVTSPQAGPPSPTGPTIILPVAGTTYNVGADLDLTVTMTWSHAGDQWQVRRRSENRTLDFDSGSDAGRTSYTFTSLAPITRSEIVEVRINTGGVWSEWSTRLINVAAPAVVNFAGLQTVSEPGAIAAMYVTEATNVLDVNLMFSTNPTQGTDFWQYQVVWQATENAEEGPAGLSREVIQSGALTDGDNVPQTTGTEDTLVYRLPIDIPGPGALWIYVSMAGGTGTFYTALYQFQAIDFPRPRNDNFNFATTLNGMSGTFVANVWGATLEDGEPYPGMETDNWNTQTEQFEENPLFPSDSDIVASEFARTVWYRWVPESEDQFLYLREIGSQSGIIKAIGDQTELPWHFLIHRDGYREDGDPSGAFNDTQQTFRIEGRGYAHREVYIQVATENATIPEDGLHFAWEKVIEPVAFSMPDDLLLVSTLWMNGLFIQPDYVPGEPLEGTPSDLGLGFIDQPALAAGMTYRPLIPTPALGRESQFANHALLPLGGAALHDGLVFAVIFDFFDPDAQQDEEPYYHTVAYLQGLDSSPTLDHFTLPVHEGSRAMEGFVPVGDDLWLILSWLTFVDEFSEQFYRLSFCRVSKYGALLEDVSFADVGFDDRFPREDCLVTEDRYIWMLNGAYFDTVEKTLSSPGVLPTSTVAVLPDGSALVRRTATLSDSFTRSDGSLGSVPTAYEPVWETYGLIGFSGGSWAIESNKARMTGTGAMAVVNSHLGLEGRIVVTYDSWPGGTSGIIFGMVDEANYYRAGFAGLYVVRNGVETLVGSHADATSTLSVTIDRTQREVVINGVTYELEFHHLGTRYGMWATSHDLASIDTFAYNTLENDLALSIIAAADWSTETASGTWWVYQDILDEEPRHPNGYSELDASAICLSADQTMVYIARPWDRYSNFVQHSGPAVSVGVSDFNGWGYHGTSFYAFDLDGTYLGNVGHIDAIPRLGNEQGVTNSVDPLAMVAGEVITGRIPATLRTVSANVRRGRTRPVGL